MRYIASHTLHSHGLQQQLRTDVYMPGDIVGKMSDLFLKGGEISSPDTNQVRFKKIPIVFKTISTVKRTFSNKKFNLLSTVDNSRVPRTCKKLVDQTNV